MTRLLATVTDHARRTLTALLEHVGAAWDCWGDGGDVSETRVTGARSDEQGETGRGCVRGATRPQNGETRETR